MSVAENQIVLLDKRRFSELMNAHLELLSDDKPWVNNSTFPELLKNLIRTLKIVLKDATKEREILIESKPGERFFLEVEATPKDFARILRERVRLYPNDASRKGSIRCAFEVLAFHVENHWQ